MKSVVIAILFTVSIILFGLYTGEKDKVPRVVERTVTVEKRVEVPKEVIKEVPVERIVEKPVPVEVIKEVPAKIPVEYENAMEVYKSVEYAIKNPVVSEGVLKGIPNVKVEILLGKAIEGILDKERLKTNLELSLRRNRIPISDASTFELLYIIEALPLRTVGGADAGVISNTTSLSISQRVLIPRERGWISTWTTVYEQRYFGVVPVKNINSLIEEAGVHIDKFSNKYLEMNPRL